MSSELLTLAREIALEAAELAARRRTEGVTVAATKSSAVDVVTAADREVEALIRDRLASARPADGFFGEETGAAASTSGVTWIVDPIDGTVNYLFGLPMYSVSIAAVEGEPVPGQWQALAGCVVNPASGEMFTASRGEGSTLNGHPLGLGPAAPLAEALIATGFSYAEDRRRRQGAMIAKLLPQLRDLRRLGSAALDISFVAAGRLDAFFEEYLSPWDYAAAALIAEEAGARIHLAPTGRITVAHPDLLGPLVAALDQAEL